MNFIRALIWPPAPPLDCTLGEWSDWDEAMRFRIRIYLTVAVIGSLILAGWINVAAP